MYNEEYNFPFFQITVSTKRKDSQTFSLFASSEIFHHNNNVKNRKDIMSYFYTFIAQDFKYGQN